MGKFMRDFWFELLLGLIVVLFLLFSVVIAVSVHDDAEGRGFTKCTSKMVMDIQTADDFSLMRAIGLVGSGYLCYFSIIGEGAKLFIEHKQSTPWANYLFKPETNVSPDDENEGFSEDLPNANLLDDEESGSEKLWDTSQKENADEK